MKIRTTINSLKSIPNVGQATVRYLNLVGVNRPRDLVGKDPIFLYSNLCKVTGKRFDPCLADVFISAVRYMEGAPPKKWWAYTAERKRILK